MSAPRFDLKAAAKNAADSIDAAVTATPAERAAADELTRELDTVYAQPTDVQRVVDAFSSAHGDVTQGILNGAALLAAERAAIHARYEAVAAQLERTASRYTMSSEQHSVRAIAAHLIRQVAAQ